MFVKISERLSVSLNYNLETRKKQRMELSPDLTSQVVAANILQNLSRIIKTEVIF